MLAFAIQGALSRGWRAVQVWDEFLDRSQADQWTRARLEAAIAYADGGEVVVIAKSLTTRAAGLVGERALRAVWLTPLLNDPESVELLRRRTAPALLVGGTADPIWDGGLARRELSDDVLELDGADHGLARVADLQPVVDAVASLSRRSADRSRRSRVRRTSADCEHGADGRDPDPIQRMSLRAETNAARWMLPETTAVVRRARSYATPDRLRRSRRAPRSRSRSRPGGTCC